MEEAGDQTGKQSQLDELEKLHHVSQRKNTVDE